MHERKGINYIEANQSTQVNHHKDIIQFVHVRGSRNEFESAMSLQSIDYLTA